MHYLKNRFVIVTGASSGIGYEISRRLISVYGAKVLGLARNRDKLYAAKQSLGENFITFQCDASQKSEWLRLAAYIESLTDKPSVIINNAGMMLPFKKLENYEENDFRNIFSTNLCSVMYSIEYILPLLSGGTEKGMVNISSSASLCPVAGQAGYAATKSAIKSLTETMQSESDFYVGLIMPGFCRTHIMDSIVKSAKEKKIIDKISQSAEKCAAKILRAIDRKKKRKIIGMDAKLMNFMYKLSPCLAVKIIAFVLRKSNFEIFNNIK